MRQIGAAGVSHLGLGSQGKEVDRRSADELGQDQVALDFLPKLARLAHRFPRGLICGRRGEQRHNGQHLLASVSDPRHDRMDMAESTSNQRTERVDNGSEPAGPPAGSARSRHRVI